MIRTLFSAAPLLALLLSSCANQGTVVQKNSSPMPFYHSLGIDGSYKLALRDSAGAVHSQLVTPEVYHDYAEGDYFNDTLPPLTPGQHPAEAKNTIALRPAPAQTLAAHGIGNGKRLAGNSGGSGRHPSMTARQPAPTTHHLVASAQKPAVSAPTVPKPAIPVVAAHFAVAVQPSTPAQPIEAKSEISPTAHVATANAQTSTRTVSIKPAASKSIAQTNTQKMPCKSHGSRAGFTAFLPCRFGCGFRRPRKLSRAARK